MITVRNLQRRERLDLPALQAFAGRALALCLTRRRSQPTPLTTLSEISILLVSDRRMAALHKQFMNIAGPTDVLTFHHGEVFISVDTARENGRRFRTSMTHELQLYLVHGLLHLHGYDDTTAAQAARMQTAQERIAAAAR
jgi:probable rRNA maturation factor